MTHELICCILLCVKTLFITSLILVNKVDKVTNFLVCEHRVTVLFDRYMALNILKKYCGHAGSDPKMRRKYSEILFGFRFLNPTTLTFTNTNFENINIHKSILPPDAKRVLWNIFR